MSNYMFLSSMRLLSFRCQSHFPSESVFREHVRGPDLCAPKTEDVEDGIGDDKLEQLLARSSKSKVATWEKLWRTLFPDDLVAPSSGKLIPLFRPDLMEVGHSLTFLDSIRALHFDRDISGQARECGIRGQDCGRTIRQRTCGGSICNQEDGGDVPATATNSCTLCRFWVYFRLRHARISPAGRHHTGHWAWI